MIKPGDIVFFRKAKRSSHRKSPEISFNGYGFAVMLGHVSLFQPDPPADHLLRLIGTIGFLSFDDVKNFLGDEAAASCVKKFEDKYYGGNNHPKKLFLKGTLQQLPNEDENHKDQNDT